MSSGMGRTNKSLLLVIIIGLGLFFTIHQSESKREAKKSENLNIKLVDVDLTMKKFYELHKKVEVIEDKPKRPEYKSVTLSSDVQDYLWDKSVKYNFSFEMLLAIIQLESNFNTKLVSQTDDYGLTQIHGSTGKWIAKELKLDKYDLFDPKTNIDFSIFYLDYLRTYWKSQGLDDESLFPVLIISYNRGESSAKKYIRKHGTETNIYLKKVREFKRKYELEATE